MAAVVVLACSACGSSSDSSQSGSPTVSASASSSPTGSPFPTEAAKSAATAALLTVSDAPAGWSTSKADDSDDPADSDKFETQLSDCLHAPPGLIGDKDTPDSVHADSPEFDAPDGNSSVSETVSVGRTSHVDQMFALLKQANATDCFTTTVGGLMKQEFDSSDDPDLKQAKLGDVSVGQLNAGHYGDDTVAMRVTVPFEVSGLSMSVYLDEVYIRHANSVADLELQGTGSPVDTQTAAKFAQLATKKLTQGTYPVG